jgi:hypothetical protein
MISAEITAVGFAPPHLDPANGYARTVTAMIATAKSTQTTAHTATKNHPSGNGGLIPGKRLDTARSFPAFARDTQISLRNA